MAAEAQFTITIHRYWFRQTRRGETELWLALEYCNEPGVIRLERHRCL